MEDDEEPLIEDKLPKQLVQLSMEDDEEPQIDDESFKQIAAQRIDAEKARNLVPFIMCTVIFLFVAVKVRQIIEYGSQERNLFTLILKAIIYLPVVFYIILCPIWNWAKKKENKQQQKYPVLGSFSLRLLCALIVIETHIVKSVYTLECFLNKISHLSIWPNFKEQCKDDDIILERLLEIAWFVSLAVFVFFNDQYRSQTRGNLYCLTLTASIVIYSYIITMILELSLIYKEIEHRIGNHGPTGEPYGEKCSNCTEMIYLEFNYVALSELQVVAISIAIAILCSVGKQGGNGHGRNQAGHFFNLKFVIFGCAAMISLPFFIFLPKVDPEIGVFRLVFTGFNLLVVILGIVLCTIAKETSTPLTRVDGEGVQHQKLERYLMFFGIMGTIAYCCVGIVHSIYLLLDPVYPEWYAVGSVVVNFVSLAQVILQSYVILHYDYTRNKRWIPILLWMVNFIMFLLDIYDAATLGVFSNHIPKTTNFTWAMFVRSLGPFIVFYRFHSLSLISESVEHSLQ